MWWEKRSPSGRSPLQGFVLGLGTDPGEVGQA